MKTLPISRYRFFQKLQPISLLKRVTSKTVNGCLQVFSTAGCWSIYIEEGKLIYAYYSENIFERLYRHLQNLSQEISTLPQGINQQLQAIFENGIEDESIPNPDYLAICWLVSQRYISPEQAGILIELLAREALETFLQLGEGSYEFISETFLDDMPKYCHLNIRLLVEQHQKPSREETYKQTSPRLSFHQSPSIPTPKIPSKLSSLSNYNIQSTSSPVGKKPYKILCIDHSLKVLDTIKNYLDEQIFSVITISDSFNALTEIMRLKPDIILLEVEMPHLDGFELCSLLRKHSSFKNTPVIMVTGKTGLIDRARAKLVKASGFLPKPFTQGDLLKILFQHIS
jgi:two-component system, chemotaxis family, response regulator PixG